MSTHYRVKHTCSKLLHNAEFLSPVNVVTTELSNNKLKCELFSKIISLYNNSLANYQSLGQLCVPYTRTQWLRCMASGSYQNQ